MVQAGVQKRTIPQTNWRFYRLIMVIRIFLRPILTGQILPESARYLSMVSEVISCLMTGNPMAASSFFQASINYTVSTATAPDKVRSIRQLTVSLYQNVSGATTDPK